jgi:hypothetical protein
LSTDLTDPITPPEGTTMRKLKLDVEMLMVDTFAPHDAPMRSTYEPAAAADPNTDFCSFYESYCIMECASDTIDRGTTH